MQQFDESKKAPAVYYPNSIGAATPGNFYTYSFLIDGKSEKGTEVVSIVDELLRRGAKILSQNSWLYEGLGEFTLSVTCDLKDSKETPDDFVIKLRAMRFVTNAKVISLKRRLFSGLLFPLTMMDTSRVVAVNSEAFFRIQDHLKSHAQKSDLVDAGRDFGKEIVKQIREKFDATSSTSITNFDEVLKDNLVGYMSAAGWGKLRWDNDNNVQRVLIQDPPTASYGGSAVGNYFLQGLVAGLTEGLLNRGFAVMEDHYDNQIRLLSLSLMEKSQATNIGQVRQTENLPNQDKVVVLREVEKLVHSVETSTPTREADQNKEPQILVPEAAEIKNKSALVTVSATEAVNQVEISTSDKKGQSKPTEERNAISLQPINAALDIDLKKSGAGAQWSQDSLQTPPSRRKPRRKAELTTSSSSENKETTESASDKTVGSNRDSSMHETIPSQLEDRDNTRSTNLVMRPILHEGSKDKTEQRAESIQMNESRIESVLQDNGKGRTNDKDPTEQTVQKKTSISSRKEFENQSNDEFHVDPDEDFYYGESFE